MSRWALSDSADAFGSLSHCSHNCCYRVSAYRNVPPGGMVKLDGIPVRLVGGF